MSFVKNAVVRPVANWMRILIFILLGAVAFSRLPLDLLPEVVQPSLFVVTSWPGVSPEDLETQITRQVEDAVSTVSGLERLSSNTSEGSSTVTARFAAGTDMSVAALDLLQQVQNAQSQFPTEDSTLKSPTVQKFDPNSFPVLVLGVSGIQDPVRLRTILQDEVKPILESASGVGSATVSGGQERAIMVNFSSQSLLAHSFSSSDLVSAITSENQNRKGGTAHEGNRQLLARSYGWLKSLKELELVPIGRVNGKLMPLRSLAHVSDSYKEPTTYQRLNGAPAGSLSIIKQSSANTITTVQAVMDKLAEVKKKYPQLQFHEVLNQSRYVQEAVYSLEEAALVGGSLAMVIVFFFLRNFRSTLVVATSIPVSVISTFTFLYAMGYSLNTMTLVGLALATGLIVDDAVVVMENIYRKMEGGLDPMRASIEGTQEITSAVLSSTITLMMVFLPLVMIPGQVGQMFRPFALVIVVSLAFSLLDALTGVPMLCSQFIRIQHQQQGFWARQFSRWESWHLALDRTYQQMLTVVLRYPGRVFTGGVVVTLLSLTLFPLIGYSFLPRTDADNLYIRLNMPRGTALEETDKAVARVEEILRKQPDVESYLATVGSDGTRDQGQVIVRLKDSRKASSQALSMVLQGQLSGIAGARAYAFPLNLVSIVMGGAQGTSLELDLFGPDLDTLAGLSNQLIQKIRSIPGLGDIRNEAGEPAPEIRWKVDREKAIQLGLSFEQVARTIETAAEGSQAGYFQSGGRRVPIVVQLAHDDRDSVTSMLSLMLSPQGSTTTSNSTSPGTLANAPVGVQLGQVAQPETATGFASIKRLTRNRYIALVSSAQQGSITDLQKSVEKAMADFSMPAGYSWSWSADMTQQVKESGQLGWMALLALVLIYMLLAIQFENLIIPLSILMSVPLCLLGIVLIFFITNTELSVMAGVGCLMLAGIAVKNGILLVENTVQKRQAGLDRTAAILEACPERLRPILITALAAMVGMVPIAVRGRGGELEAPMAIAVIGGLLASTLLTLFVVPCAYVLLDELERKWLKKNA